MGRIALIAEEMGRPEDARMVAARLAEASQVWPCVVSSLLLHFCCETAETKAKFLTVCGRDGIGDQRLRTGNVFQTCFFIRQRVKILPSFFPVTCLVAFPLL